MGVRTFWKLTFKKAFCIVRITKALFTLTNDSELCLTLAHRHGMEVWRREDTVGKWKIRPQNLFAISYSNPSTTLCPGHFRRNGTLGTAMGEFKNIYALEGDGRK